jgi:Ca-activated chloride channel homolog
VPIEKIESKLHKVEIVRNGKKKATVSLKNKKEIPNKDFVLRYMVVGDKVRSGILTHRDGDDGYVCLIMIPPRRVKPAQICPRELIFVVDASGSQKGLPLAKSKETMKYVIDRMNPHDTFNCIDFSNQPRMLFSYPKENELETRDKARQYIGKLSAGGGTQMVPALWQALSTPPAENRLRIITFMTDGYVGNDFEVISMVKKLRGDSRWFVFGTGNSVNRFLLDNVARVGGGEVDYILLNSSAEDVAKKFYERIAAPVLTNITLSVDGIQLEDVYPATASDLWSRKPLIFKARYKKAGKGLVKIKGLLGGKPYEQILNLVLPQKATENSAIASIWARAKVHDLMDNDLMGIQRGNPKPDVKEAVVRTALAHRLVTQFTSFVAVEETVMTVAGKPKKVTVPVEMPDGVSREGIFGSKPKTMHANWYRIRQVQPKSGSWPLHMNGEFEYRYSYIPRSGPTDLFGSPGGGGVPVQGRASGRREARALYPTVSYSYLPRPQMLGIPSPEEGSSGKNRKLAQDIAFQSQPQFWARASGKFAPELIELIQMKEKPKNFSKGTVQVKDGLILVQVWVTRVTDEIIESLKRKGLQMSFEASTGKTVVGLISVERLEELSRIEAVRRVEPFTTG